MLESMDASLGAVLDELEALGIAEDTFVVFISDNGGLSNHVRVNSANPGDPWKRDRHNAPLASGKGAAHEGGIRVPMIAAWAGQSADGDAMRPELPIAPGSRSSVPVRSEDVFPTILSLAGVDAAGAPLGAIDGEDLRPVLGGEDSLERAGELVWHYPHQWRGDLGVGPGIEPSLGHPNRRLEGHLLLLAPELATLQLGG